MAEPNILELVRNRSSPGVLICGADNTVLYANRAAAALLAESNEILPEVRRLCERVRAAEIEPGAAPVNCALVWRREGPPYSLRAFFLRGPSQEHHATHVMVLVEKITERHGINLRRAKDEFALSDREVEVASLLAQGCSNKEIGCKLFISESTVKDHLKHISRKTLAGSRGEIIAKLK